MKAVGYKKSLPIEDAQSLFDFETAKPEPKGRDIRVAVKAISANPVDYKVRKRAAPPEGETKILGYDAAGIVDAVGPEVTLFKPGDEVFYAGSICARAPTRNFIWSMNVSSAASRSRSRSRRPLRYRLPRSPRGNCYSTASAPCRARASIHARC